MMDGTGTDLIDNGPYPFFSFSRHIQTSRNDLLNHFGFNTHQFCYFKKHVKFSIPGHIRFWDIDVFVYEVGFYYSKHYSISHLGKYNWYLFWNMLRKINSDNIDDFKCLKIILNDDSNEIEMVAESSLPGVIFENIIIECPFLNHFDDHWDL